MKTWKDPEAQKLFLSGKSILEELETSDLFENHSADDDYLHQYPAFDISEIVIGPVLGHGGFGIVNEVQDIVLSNDNTTSSTSTTTNMSHTLNPIVVHEHDDATTESDSDNNCSNANLHQRRHKTIEGSESFDSNLARSYLAANVRRRCTTPALSESNHGSIMMFQKNKAMASLPSNGNSTNTNSAAPSTTTTTTTTTTAARYAIKRLKSDLNELNCARGAIDLAIEVRILSRLHHPNIVKMRGYAKNPLLDSHFFILMDRLYEILNHRILEWKVELQKYSNSIWLAILPHRRRLNQRNNNNNNNSIDNPIDRKHEREHVLHNVMVQRLIVAYDLASAFAYMHENSVVYRDIKQENIGFDIRGDVKVFDFGLSRATSPSIKARDTTTGAIEYGYNLTPRTGSIPYMAPEVMAGRPYDGQCDVFSFAILLWEIFNLRPAFRYLDRHEYIERVVRNGERLSFPIRSGIVPASIKDLIKDAWNGKPTQRPLMANVAKRIRNELNHMSDGDDAILRRSIHMNNRSNHSFRIEVLKQRSNNSQILRSSSSNLLRRSSSSFRESTHGSISPSKAKSSNAIDIHYSGPSLHNGLEA